ncbi:MAG TPA: exodeoxyribonuclease VII small subunit [Candidatus Saccharimonadales bacterium]|jgi:exodeoxyribonuclease VII small subunit|nr:exodeoxyribonuclease VII small subunit [Candidatus Saccharimonadales bacterium]
MSEKSEKKSLQAQLSELDELLAWFEQTDFDVEAALQKYEDGMKLIGEISDRLKTVENKVEVLKKRFDQVA